MKSIVIYFSQTGNTEKVAKAISTGIAQVAGSCDLMRIQDVNPLRLGEYDLIGLGSPVFGDPPANVTSFVGRLRFVGGKHAFAFCTHGTAHELFFPSLYPKLKDRGLEVIGLGEWYGDCYLLHMTEPYPTAGHPDEIDLEEAEGFGREMVLRSWKISAGATELIPPPPRTPVLKMEMPLPAPDRMAMPLPGAGKNAPNGPQKMTGSFRDMLKFHKEKCLYPNCTLCMENCPVVGIDLSVDPPRLAQPCLECEFCARLCPTGALDMDEWVEAMFADSGFFRQMMLKNTERAEAEGTFRRLVPKDELNPDVAGYMLRRDHPQWVIGKGRQ